MEYHDEDRPCPDCEEEGHTCRDCYECDRADNLNDDRAVGL